MSSQLPNGAASQLTSGHVLCYGITVRGVLLGDAQPEAVQQLIKQGRLQSGEFLEPLRVSLPKTLHQVVIVRVPQLSPCDSQSLTQRDLCIVCLRLQRWV